VVLPADSGYLALAFHMECLQTSMLRHCGNVVLVHFCLNGCNEHVSLEPVFSSLARRLLCGVVSHSAVRIQLFGGLDFSIVRMRSLEYRSHAEKDAALPFIYASCL